MVPRCIAMHKIIEQYQKQQQAMNDRFGIKLIVVTVSMAVAQNLLINRCLTNTSCENIDWENTFDGKNIKIR